MKKDKKQFLVTLHACAHWLHHHKLRFISRIVEIFIRLVYTATLPAAVTLGKNVHFGHNGLAVVLNPLSRIGNNCMIGSHVVLGGKFPVKGAPLLEDDVIVHAGAKIIGKITIGKGSVIGANAVVLTDIPSRSLVAGVPGTVKKSGINIDDYREW